MVVRQVQGEAGVGGDGGDTVQAYNYCTLLDWPDMQRGEEVQLTRDPCLIPLAGFPLRSGLHASSLIREAWSCRQSNWNPSFTFLVLAPRLDVEKALERE